MSLNGRCFRPAATAVRDGISANSEAAPQWRRERDSGIRVVGTCGSRTSLFNAIAGRCQSDEGCVYVVLLVIRKLRIPRRTMSARVGGEDPRRRDRRDVQDVLSETAGNASPQVLQLGGAVQTMATSPMPQHRIMRDGCE